MTIIDKIFLVITIILVVAGFVLVPALNTTLHKINQGTTCTYTLLCYQNLT